MFLGKGESAPEFPEGALVGVAASPGAALPTANSSSTAGPRADISVNRYFCVDVLWVTQNFSVLFQFHGIIPSFPYL